MSSTSRDTGDTSNSPTGSPRLGGGLLSSGLAHGIGLTLVLGDIGVHEGDNVGTDGGEEDLREGGLFGGLSGLTGENRNLRASSHCQ